MSLRKIIFRFIASANKMLLPSMRNKNLAKLNNAQKLLVAWRYWITKNSL